jgi:FlaG/FlaF family flagellin (archaellin)
MKAVVGTVIAVVLAGLIAAGCGGSSSSKHKTKTAAHHSTTTTNTSTGASAATATTPTVSSGPVHATLKGENHTPIAGKPWTYTVRATSASGKPLSGTVETEFAFAGTVVGRESPPVHKLKNGVLHDKITFPSSAVGHPITLVTVVRTSAGSVALGWPVSARK